MSYRITHLNTSLLSVLYEKRLTSIRCTMYIMIKSVCFSSFSVLGNSFQPFRYAFCIAGKSIYHFAKTVQLEKGQETLQNLKTELFSKTLRGSKS